MSNNFSTPYSRAWAIFITTVEFKEAVQQYREAMPSLERQYIENRLKRMFDAGWNAKTSYILESLERIVAAKKTK